jgi:probable rRNA maturation factor
MVAGRAGRVILLNHQHQVTVNTLRLQRQSVAMLEKIRCPKFDVTIWLTDDERLREMNSEFRGKDKPTDILSFPLRKVDRGTQPQAYYGVRDLGQLFISVPFVQQNIRQTDSLENELCFMTAHGILHLLGYNDEGTDEEAVIMEAENERLYRLVRDVD